MTTVPALGLLSIKDELLERAAHEAYARHMGTEATRLLRKTFQQLAQELVRGTLTPARRAEISAFLTRVGPTLGATYQKIAMQAEVQLRDLARAQSGALTSRLAAQEQQHGSVLLTAERIDAIVKLPIQDLPLGDWWKREAADMTRRTRTAIQQGLLQGRPLREIAAAVAGPRPADRSAYRAAAARAMTVTRTAAAAVAAETDRAVFRAVGPSVTDRYVFRATMDGRTSDICRSTDGRVFRYDDPSALMPPLHPNCRSTIVPLINTAQMDKKQREAVAKAQGQDGRLPPTRTVAMYEAWLKQQPPRILQQILGTNAEAWKAGTMKLPEAMATNRTIYTAHQLERALTPSVVVDTSSPATLNWERSYSDANEVFDEVHRFVGDVLVRPSVRWNSSEVAQLFRADGLYSPLNRRIEISPATTSQIRRFVAGERSPAAYKGVHVVVHEMHHAASKALHDTSVSWVTASPTTRETWRWLEEGLVESRTRRRLGEAFQKAQDAGVQFAYDREVQSIQNIRHVFGEAFVEELWAAPTPPARVALLLDRTMGILERAADKLATKFGRPELQTSLPSLRSEVERNILDWWGGSHSRIGQVTRGLKYTDDNVLHFFRKAGLIP